MSIDKLSNRFNFHYHRAHWIFFMWKNVSDWLLCHFNLIFLMLASLAGFALFSYSMIKCFTSSQVYMLNKYSLPLFLLPLLKSIGMRKCPTLQISFCPVEKSISLFQAAAVELYGWYYFHRYLCWMTLCEYSLFFAR